ncbi:hypothetical protein HPB49_000577 [Dermacentor silvarum]|uniref:Uncharacterized protein n=1 Tax=Dermacentor silvarum TaxID=543639 RepID=A0ACB8DT48_DERSI|nr:hypothetical protein HPB49_000577 [Dermacentor silvarum]
MWLSLGQRVYPITTYFAAPDNSCKGIVPELVPGTPSSMLVDELLAPGTQVLQARMMGQTNVALVTFEGLKVPRYVRFYTAKLRSYPHRPRQLVCKICRKLGHWADYCPTPYVVICATWGTDNPTPSHPCTPHCTSCDETHRTTDPNCPRRARQTLNKAWVRTALEKEQRELQTSIDPTTTTDTTETRTSRAPTMEIRQVRSETRSRSRRKSRTGSKSRSRSREASMRLPEKRIDASPSSQQPYKKSLQTNAPAKVTQAPSEVQRTPEKKTATEAPREVSRAEGPPQLAPPRKSLPTPSPLSNSLSTSDPLIEIARLRRDTEARCERLQKQMDALVADMGTSMQAALDRIERQMEDLRIGITEQVKSCIESTFERIQVAELSAYSASLPPDQSSRPDTSNAKGTRLWNDICNMRYTLLTDTEHPTHIGNSRDTCPELTFVRNTGPVVAHGPLEEHLGSDHYIVATTLPLRGARRPERNVRITDWAKFRERRQDQPEGQGYE